MQKRMFISDVEVMWNHPVSEVGGRLENTPSYHLLLLIRTFRAHKYIIVTPELL